jgi:acetate kinase
MNILVINCGSSSVKADILDSSSGHRHQALRIERIGSLECQATLDGVDYPLAHLDHENALTAMLPKLDLATVDAVGHRIVHGGSQFSTPTVITEAVLEEIGNLIPLAPLHNPPNLIGVRVAMELAAEVPQVAVFDTAFHATLPRRAQQYALPRELVAQYGLRRYGFHGPSHQWVSTKAAQWLDEELAQLRIITCHLGNGASVCAVEYGRSVETSMGMTPVEGLVMGTRSGDVDPGILVDLLRREGWTAEELDRLLNRQSGLKGLSGLSNDLRDIQDAAADGDEDCRMALQVFAHRLRKYIGAYATVMAGVDAIVFTAGIGENSADMRHRVAQRLDFLGARLDEDRNREAYVSRQNPVFEISSARSRVKILVVATDEAHAIAESSAAILKSPMINAELTIPVSISARHIHLTQEAVETLFGDGHQLTPYRPLSQPGQFACEERLTIMGPRNKIERVRVLGPVRPKCQVEVSRTDEFNLGIDAPVRNSGDVGNSPGVTLIGPEGELTLKEGLICARRHIHMTPEDATRFGVNDRDVVDVAINSAGRDLVFGDVLIRVKSSYALEMHIDTDEANAAEVVPGQEGVLEPTTASAKLKPSGTAS